MEKRRTLSLLYVLLLFLILPVPPAYSQARTIPDSAYISGVVGHPQSFMLSCESRSAVDLAAFWGVSISEGEFLAGLPSSDNPEEGFVGNPNDAWGNIPPNSYGVHAAPVAGLLRKYGLRVEARRGLQWDDLRSEIAAGRPAIVWVVGAMWPGKTLRYTASDGTKTTVARFEHTMILTGYNADQVHVIDAYSGLNQVYSLNAFLASWEVLGNMAVFGKGKKSSATLPAGTAKTYTVQRGDYLIALAKRFGVSWQELAALNHIQYPYSIYPGQVLTLPGSQAPEEPAPSPTGSPKKTPTPIPSLGLRARVLLPFVSGLDSTRAPARASKSPSTKPALPEAYTVQRGDYLIALADKFGLDWRSLAEINRLSYPFVLYPGQVLKLKSGK